jgi:hypothetical protein
MLITNFRGTVFSGRAHVKAEWKIIFLEGGRGKKLCCYYATNVYSFFPFISLMLLGTNRTLPYTTTYAYHM